MPAADARAWARQPTGVVPDGKALAFTATVGDDSDLVFRAAAHVIDAHDPHASARSVGSTDGFATRVAWTTDGTALIVAGWPSGPTGHVRLLKLPLDGTAPLDLAESLDRNVMLGAPAYPGAVPELDDGKTLVFCARDRGCTHLYAVDIDTDGSAGPRAVLDGEGRVVWASRSPTGSPRSCSQPPRRMGRSSPSTWSPAPRSC